MIQHLEIVHLNQFTLSFVQNFSWVMSWYNTVFCFSPFLFLGSWLSISTYHMFVSLFKIKSSESFPPTRVQLPLSSLFSGLKICLIFRSYLNRILPFHVTASLLSNNQRLLWVFVCAWISIHRLFLRASLEVFLREIIPLFQSCDEICNWFTIICFWFQNFITIWSD